MKILQVFVLVLVGLLVITKSLGQSKTDDLILVQGTVKFEKTFDSKGKVNTKERIVKGAIVGFKGGKSKVYQTKTDEKGKYQIKLPAGKYQAYSTVNSDCWICAGFIENNFLVIKKRKIKFNILLRFEGEG